MSVLVIGIERGPDSKVSEQEVLTFFRERGFEYDDDYLIKGESRIEYFIIEKARYIIFTEDNDMDLFTQAVIDFIRTLEEGDCITVKERVEGAERIAFQEGSTLFEGSAPSFIGFWDTLGDEEE